MGKSILQITEIEQIKIAGHTYLAWIFLQKATKLLNLRGFLPPISHYMVVECNGVYYWCTIHGVGVCEIGEDVESGPQSPSVPDTAGVGGLERTEVEGETRDSGEMVATATSTKRSRVKVCSSISTHLQCQLHPLKNNSDM